jgi:hypothetical protein
MYAGGPAGEGLLFLLERDGAEPVGVTGIGRRKFALGDDVVRAGIMADFTVAPEHRSLMPALKLLRASVAGSLELFDFLYSLPNERAEAVFMRAGYRKLGEMVRYVRPTRSTRFFESRLGRLWGRIVAPFVDVALWARDLAGQRHLRRRFRSGERRDFDASFDTLWTKRFTASALISVRSQETLAWRFLEGEPTPDWRISTVHGRASDQLCGYAVWRVEADTAQVADFLWSDDSSAAALLERVAWSARRAGCSSIALEFSGGGGVAAIFNAAGFWTRESHPVYYVAGKAGAAPPLTDWYLTTFDRD